MILQSSGRTLKASSWFLLVVLVSLILPAEQGYGQNDSFVRVQEGHFVLDGKPYYYTGANFWYGMYLGQKGAAGDRQRLIRELDHLKKLGVTNLRVMAATEGPDTQPQRVKPAVQAAPGVYSEDLLQGLDFLLAEMGKRDMKAVLCLNNFFQWSGGMAQYVSWATGTKIPFPEIDGHTWDEFQNYSARFYAEEKAQQLFDNYVRMLVSRKNSVSGKPYVDDTAIMAWQLANEPRGFGYSDQYVVWADRAAGLIHRLDPNHLVSLGGEGKLIPGNGTQFEKVSRSKNLDYLTIHIWIENWAWFSPANPQMFESAVGKAMGYLADHVSIANSLDKPLVVEEFGASRDFGAYASTAPVTVRDRYYRILLETLHKLAEEGNAIGGSNVWSWGGEGHSRQPGLPWQPGEPFSGDPPHEKQGWYSIYDTDAGTLNLLSEYAHRMDTLQVINWSR